MPALPSVTAPVAIKEEVLTPAMPAPAPVPAAVPMIPQGAPSDAVPWAAFGLAFTVFPASVIFVSEGLKEKATSSDKASDASGRNAPDIFLTGLNNLKDEPTGWLFGEPSVLYS